MKNLFKFGFLGLALTFAAAACNNPSTTTEETADSIETSIDSLTDATTDTIDSIGAAAQDTVDSVATN